MTKRSSWILLTLAAAALGACGSPNPLVGQWTSTQPFAGSSSSSTGTLTTVVTFGADNTLSMTVTGATGCSGSVRFENYGITLNMASSTSGTYVATRLGTCTGGPVQCEFGGGSGSGNALSVAQCSGTSAGVSTMAGQYVLSGDGRTLSLNGVVYTRVN